jgi:DNA-binding transcriptional regulator YbjK
MGSTVPTFRKLPQQQRSRVMVSIIVEAAQQVLDRRGETGFNTNAIAERAGISIGSLYQYFQNKQACVAARARQGAWNGDIAA